jgi:hypothetical protein
MATTVRWQAEPIYHLHLRKTAGSALSRFLAPGYLPHQRLRLLNFQELALFAQRDLVNFRFYACHFGPGMVDLVNRPDVPVITVLRDPVERLISSVIFQLHIVAAEPGSATPAYREAVAALRRSTLYHQVETLGTELFRNGQVQELGTHCDMRPYLADGAFTRAHGQALAPDIHAVIHRQADVGVMMTAAHATLARMAMVGLTERFAETLELVAALAGRPPPAVPPVVNLGALKDDVALYFYRATCPPAVIELAEALTVADRELYAHAQTLFAEQLARHRANPHRTYSIMPRILLAARPILRAVRAGGRRSPPKTAPL